MEEEKRAEAAPEQDAAAEAEAARKREEAIRQVESMLNRDRTQKAQRQIEVMNYFGRHHRGPTIVMTEEQAYNPRVDLVQYEKPDKPEEEMTPDELAAEQKRQEAIQKVNAMFLQQQATRHNENYHARTVILPKRRKPIEENSVDITGFLSQFKLSPEAQERFEKIRYGVGKGTVRPSAGIRLCSLFLPPMLLFFALVLKPFAALAGVRIIFLIVALLLIAEAYYVHTWKLEYDSDSGLVRYHSLFHGTNLYELRDLMTFMVSAQPEKPFPLSLLGLLDPRQYLVIRLPDHTINIPLLFSTSIIAQPIEINGYEGASEFYRCLTQYEHDMYSKQAAAEETSAPEPAPEKPAPPKPETPEAPKPEKPEPKPAPQLSPEELAKARELFAQPAASALSVPERSTAFPDPTQSAFPDPAQKPKSDADVDALFNQVLREHGKLK